jgi:hypothetical protein
MARKRRPKLAFGFSSAWGDFHPETHKPTCIVCEVEFLPTPVHFTISTLEKDGCVETRPGLDICPSCILSDTKTLTAKTRTTAKKHQQKTERLRIEHGPGAEDLEDYELEEDWCDNSDFLNEFCDDLTRLGDVSKIVNHDLAVSITKHNTRKAA